MGRTRLGRRRRAPRLINAALAPYCLPCLRKANGFLFIDVLESEGVFNGHIIIFCDDRVHQGHLFAAIDGVFEAKTMLFERF